MNFINTGNLSIELSLSYIRDKEKLDYIRSLLKDKYIINNETITERENDKLLGFTSFINNLGFSYKQKILFYKNLKDLKKYFDQSKLHDERFALIPDICRLTKEIAEYAEEDTEFKEALNQRFFDINANKLIDKWKLYGIEITKDDYLALYAMTGWFSNSENRDILSSIPSMGKKKKEDRNNSLYALYLCTAIKYHRFDVFDKLFEGWTLLDKLDYFGNCEFLDHIQPTDDKEIAALLPSREGIKNFFSDWIRNLLSGKPTIDTVRAFFPMLYEAPHYKASNFIYTICQHSASTQDLIHFIAQQAVSFSPSDFFQRDTYNNCGTMPEIELAIFSCYCKLITPKTHDDIIAIARYWYKLIEYEQTSFYHDNSNFWSLMDTLIGTFLDDTLLTALLQIPEKLLLQDDKTPCFYIYDFDWFAHFIALYLLSKKNQLPKKNIISRAINKVIEGKYRELPETVLKMLSELITTEEDRLFDSSESGTTYLIYLLYIDNIPPSESLTFAQKANKELWDKEICYWLYYIALEKNHGTITDDILLQELPFELLKYRIKDNPSLFLKESLVLLNKAGQNFEEIRKAVWKIKELAKTISGLPLFSVTQKREILLSFLIEEQRDQLFKPFFDAAINESESDYIALYTLLELHVSLPQDFEQYFRTFQNHKTLLTSCCSKLLNSISKKQPSEWISIFDCVIQASWYLVNSKKSLWSGLHPLLTAFRNSKEVLVNLDLSPEHKLASSITRFFRYSEPKDLKALRQDMANEFCKYLSPKTDNLRSAEKYTNADKAESDYFRLDFTEPSPYWRYAYARSLEDIEATTDGKGHFFHERLKKAAENEPCPEVKVRIEKTISKLERIRKSVSHGNHHTRRLYEAFWWLREAHRRSLGLPIDTEASKLLRIKEWRDERE